MFLRKQFDPRLNPHLRPDQWGRYRLRLRWILWILAAVMLVTAVGGSYYLWGDWDRTRDMEPKAVVEAAGLAILRADGYHFTVDLQGESKDKLFPAVRMKGEFQRTPLALHLAGNVAAGESLVDLEYYVEQQDVYLRHPTSKLWLLMHGYRLEELASYYPANLAAPLVTGVLKAEELRRERLPGGRAIVYRLELDSKIMRNDQSDKAPETVEYELWVYARTLQPARFITRVKTKPEAQESKDTLWYTYTLDFATDEVKPVVVPDSVKQSAQDAAEADAKNLPPRPLQGQ